MAILCHIAGIRQSVGMTRQTKSLLTSAEAASFLGVSIATLHRLARSGDLEEVHKGTGLRGPRVFHVDELSRVATERNLAQ